ncbi:MAG: TonB-dependent receptor [Muribaculaceae bacterium]|nr:TonB-dependent receptor [Muribaculaceae bacterium]
MNSIKTVLAIACAISSFTTARSHESSDSTGRELDELVVVQRQGIRRMSGAVNGQVITASELKRAACCNLGESFTTNPSVDVNYSDAATGARQIRLLGLSGSYVQMLTENVPNFRGAAAPYGLGYVAGPWMQSIQVSKGASSVKNGYESLTGQINIEMKKPQADPSFSANVYYDMMNKLELNADGNIHFGESWSAGLLTHFENGFSEHDGNGDGFSDMPRVRQLALMPRVAYLGSSYVFQAAVKYLDERRLGGQHGKHAHSTGSMPLYRTDIDTRRLELMTKNAYIFDRDNDGNIALILSASGHNQKASYGLRLYRVEQREAYGSLMFERKWGGLHALSTGISASYDRLDQHYRLLADATLPADRRLEEETVGGAYAQYTFNLDERFIGMAGIRYDYSSAYGSMVTPRLHLRYKVLTDLSLHASAGRGFRSPHPLAEYAYMLASSRRIVLGDKLRREAGWNFGAGADYTFYPAGKKLGIAAEYYYTTFSNQLMLNLDRDPHAAYIYSSAARSRSHAVQVELTFEPLKELSLTAAWRLTDVKADYGDGRLTQKPLTSRNKGLFTIGWAPQMGLWQADVSLAINGGGRMPAPYRLESGEMSWRSRYGTWLGLNAQVTRNFRHWSIYIGGENLTNYRQPNAIVGASDPWGPDFDATMIYGPLQGAMVYVGFRYNFTKYI